MPLFASGLNPRLQNWRGQWVWIIGASSGIGRATAEALLRQGARVIVSARKIDVLQAMARDFRGCVALPLDVTRPGELRAAVGQVGELTQGVPALVMYCAGHYQPMRATALDAAEMQRHLQINYIGVLQLLDALLPAMIAARRGHLCLVGSVAGYRGLPLSLAYGPTKAALNNLAENLYLDLHPLGLGVSIVNPGFVDTPLTAGNEFPMPSLISPEAAAGHILRGWARGRFEMNFPRRFTRWMRLLRCLPDAWYFAVVRRATGA